MLLHSVQLMSFKRSTALATVKYVVNAGSELDGETAMPMVIDQDS
jgi:hypothetical protein